jgi:ribose transport system substrate-binding protein
MKRLISILVVACMLLGLFACSAAPTTATEPSKTEAVTDSTTTDPAETPSDQNYDFTFICPLVGNEYFVQASEGIAKADAEFGTKTQMVGPSTLDNFAEEATKYFEATIASNVDGIMTDAIYVDLFTPLIAKAVAAGIPVVLIDSDAKDSARSAYAGTHPYEAGRAAGLAMVEGTGGKANIAVLSSDLTNEKLSTELQGFNDVIKDYPDMKIIATELTDADLLKATEKMQALVETYPEMNAVLGMTAYDVQGAAKVVTEMDLKGMTLVGYDDLKETLEYIKSGTIYATIVQDPYMMGYTGVKLLKQIKDGEKLESTDIDTGVVTVTSKNVDTYRQK